MNKLAADKLTELVEHNSNMLKDAEAGNWEKVTENEIIRQQLIKAFYSVISGLDETAAVASATKELVLVNEKLTQFACKARDKVKMNLAELGKGKSAINAYVQQMR
jgi:hypothetical protein